ncbi:hypothetical protein Btru_002224 [Bulinus truncatus]|nr:hypothetical protein Btru_002224 [Bulinus truncatus]
MTDDYFAIGATVIAAAIFVGWLVSWLIHLISICFGIHHLYKKLEPVIPEEDLPGVSILKPLTGVDTNLKSNLETFFTQKYPKYELLFSVPDDNDPAILVVKSLIDSYPKVDAKLFIGLKVVGPNGKINNMVCAYEAAKYDNIVISDIGIKMTPMTLYEMVHCLKPDVGEVLQMPYCATRKGFGAVYQQVYFGTMQARNCLSANAVKINCSTGMSTLLRRDVLDKAGGLAEFGKYLAEDFFIAEAIRSQGYKVVLSTTPALQNSGNCSISEFHSRLVRWAQLRMSMLPTLIFLEPVGESVLLGIFISWAAMILFEVSPLAFFMAPTPQAAPELAPNKDTPPQGLSREQAEQISLAQQQHQQLLAAHRQQKMLFTQQQAVRQQAQARAAAQAQAAAQEQYAQMMQARQQQLYLAQQQQAAQQQAAEKQAAQQRSPTREQYEQVSQSQQPETRQYNQVPTREEYEQWLAAQQQQQQQQQQQFRPQGPQGPQVPTREEYEQWLAAQQQQQQQQFRPQVPQGPTREQYEQWLATQQQQQQQFRPQGPTREQYGQWLAAQQQHVPQYEQQQGMRQPAQAPSHELHQQTQQPQDEAARQPQHPQVQTREQWEQVRNGRQQQLLLAQRQQQEILLARQQEQMLQAQHQQQQQQQGAPRGRPDESRMQPVQTQTEAQQEEQPAEENVSAYLQRTRPRYNPEEANLMLQQMRGTPESMNQPIQFSAQVQDPRGGFEYIQVQQRPAQNFFAYSAVFNTKGPVVVPQAGLENIMVMESRLREFREAAIKSFYLDLAKYQEVGQYFRAHLLSKLQMIQEIENQLATPLRNALAEQVTTQRLNIPLNVPSSSMINKLRQMSKPAASEE